MTGNSNSRAETLRALARVVASAPRPTPAAIAQAKLLVLDTIGCGLAAANDPVAAAVRAVVPREARPLCPIIGHRQRTDIPGAVLANGAAIRVLDLNDYLVGQSRGQPETARHPSDNIPVALATGSARRRGGAEILSTIVVGYELFFRLQNLMDRGGGWDGATASGLVAAAMAGRLMALDEDKLAHAMAIGLARAPTPAIVRSGELSAMKSLSNALVAQAGAQAALLAEQGITGPLAILDEARGFGELFAHGTHETLTAPVPEDGGAIMRAHVKAYPCVNTGQSAVAAALALRDTLKTPPRSLVRLEIAMADYPIVKRHQEDPARVHPTSRESADHSFPFLVAAALIDGAFGLAQFANERWRDPDVTALMAKIAMRRDPALNARAPGAYPCALHAWDENGREYRCEILFPPGFSRNGLDDAAVIAKFHAVVAPGFDEDLRQRIVDAVMTLDTSANTAALDSAIAIEGSSP